MYAAGTFLRLSIHFYFIFGFSCTYFSFIAWRFIAQILIFIFAVGLFCTKPERHCQGVWDLSVFVLVLLTHTRNVLFAVCSRLVSVFLLQLHFNV